MQHHVYFWLKEQHKNDADRQVFEQSLKKLSAIAHIETSGWGKPAATPKRPVIENSYCYGTYLSFTSIAEHDAYQDHPDHLEFVEKHKDWWEKVLIMDVE